MQQHGETERRGMNRLEATLLLLTKGGPGTSGVNMLFPLQQTTNCSLKQSGEEIKVLIIKMKPVSQKPKSEEELQQISDCSTKRLKSLNRETRSKI